MNWKQVRTVMGWEIKKNLRSPGFMLMTFVIPLLMLAAGALPFLTGQGNGSTWDPLTIAVMDETEANQFASRFTDATVNDVLFVLHDGSGEELKEAVSDGRYDGGLILQESVLEGSNPTVVLLDMSLQNQIVNRTSSFIDDMVLNAKLAQLDLTSNEKEKLIQPVMLSFVPTVETDPADEPQEGASSIVDAVLPMILGVLLMVSLLMLGQVLMYGVIKEKKNRIVEVLLSSLTASELLTGKLLSFGLLSMIQIAIWVSTGLFAVNRFFDVELSFNESIGKYVPMFLYFVLGYLLISSLFAAMGAMMKDAESGSQVQGLIVLIPMMPILLATPIIMAPNALWVRIFSFIPIFTPGTMLLRIGMTDIPAWEMATTLGVLAISVIWFNRIAARIFAGSILQFDTAASLKQIMSMVRRG